MVKECKYINKQNLEDCQLEFTAKAKLNGNQEIHSKNYYFKIK